ncbi:MAG: hydroxylamine reductase, partial [Thermoproteota archaeon]|nr:hydroxylamine reductase [Thermoproteota archaeon]
MQTNSVLKKANALIQNSSTSSTAERKKMFCYQCEQTAESKGCTRYGVCGKSPEVATLQDLLIYALKGLSLYAIEGRKVGINDSELNKFTCEAVFATLTNVNFDPERLEKFIRETVERRDALKLRVQLAGGKTDFDGPAKLIPEKTIPGLVKQGEEVGIWSDLDIDADVHSLMWALTYGIKGIAAYADHASILGKEDDAVFRFIQEGLIATLDKKKTLQEMIDLVMKAGQINLRAMELLDEANTRAYGNPTPTKVPLGTKIGKAILES